MQDFLDVAKQAALRAGTILSENMNVAVLLAMLTRAAGETVETVVPFAAPVHRAKARCYGPDHASTRIHP